MNFRNFANILHLFWIILYFSHHFRLNLRLLKSEKHRRKQCFNRKSIEYFLNSFQHYLYDFTFLTVYFLLYTLHVWFKVLKLLRHKSELVLEVNKGAISLSSGTVHVVSTAEPVIFWAASSRARGSITWLFLGSHLDQSLLGSNKGAVSLSSGTVHVVGAAEPVIFWAASGRARGSITWLLKLNAGCLWKSQDS